MQDDAYIFGPIEAENRDQTIIVTLTPLVSTRRRHVRLASCSCRPCRCSWHGRCLCKNSVPFPAPQGDGTGDVDLYCDRGFSVSSDAEFASRECRARVFCRSWCPANETADKNATRVRTLMRLLMRPLA